MKPRNARRRKAVRIACLSLTGFVLLLTALLIFAGRAEFSFTKDVFTENDYSTVMKDSISLSSNPRAVDIAMLGAHDAFSNNINGKSEVDPQESDSSILNNSAVKLLANGMFVRLSRAQKSGAYDLLKRGVRYFDVRITLKDGEWYTTHGLLSDRLEGYLLETLKFLSETNGEFVVFDIQHAYVGSKTFGDLFDYIGSVSYSGKSLFDYVSYEPFDLKLDELRYDALTQGHTASGAVILAKTAQYEGCYHYNYSDSIRSVWHEKNTASGVLKGIEREYETLKNDENLDRNKFRVNQAQMTGLYSAGDIPKTLQGWSLLDMADSMNQSLVNNDAFSSWLAVMPIFMVDYSDSMRNSFNDIVISKINSFNSSQH